ncbi:MAG: hypothetical protein QOF26_1775 [Baekduia sp.]|jgi:hypothetical protein|nr:hypothetical protein [Baekduia sp.]MDX6701549.1 hypothetical protein [Baekduia sp.]
MKTAKDWYGSPEYQAMLHLRTHDLFIDLVLIDLVDPDFTSAARAREIQDVIAATPGRAN